MKKKISWRGWHENEKRNFMVGVAQKLKKLCGGGGTTMKKRNIMVGVAQK
jgi:hypothetical protein